MPRVLLVDDQPHVRSTISILLTAKEFDVVQAESGAMALDKFGNTKFDLAIIDIYMRGMDGVQIIKALRKSAPNLPVIAISGVLLNASTRTALEFLPLIPELSDVICLQKPFRSGQLFEAIKKVMGVSA